MRHRAFDCLTREREAHSRKQVYCVQSHKLTCKRVSSSSLETLTTDANHLPERRKFGPFWSRRITQSHASKNQNDNAKEAKEALINRHLTNVKCRGESISVWVTGNVKEMTAFNEKSACGVLWSL